MMKLDKVHWGMIGCGAVTEVKSGPGFQLAQNSELVAVMRRNGELAKDYAQRHKVETWYEDAMKLIHDPKVDAVYIATPPVSHMEYVLACAKAGKPVYVEKPMARTYKECKEMIEACESHGVPVFVAYYRRALPRFLKIKELLDSGVLGEVRYVNIRNSQTLLEADEKGNLPWRVDPAIAGGGIFFDIACHILDVFDFLLGPIKEVNGHSSNQGGSYQAEDIVSGEFVFQSGVHGTGMWCFSAFEKEDINIIVGSKGQMEFSTFGNEAIRVRSIEGESEYEIINPLHIQQPLIQTIVDELTGKGSCPSTGRSAARTSWVMDRMVRSVSKG